MTFETPKGGCSRPSTPTDESSENVTLDEELRLLVVDLAAIDRETQRYRRKCDGLEPWTAFQAPETVRQAA